MNAKPGPESSKDFSYAATDFRTAAQRAQQDKAHERQQQLASQASASNTPDERIRIWERLHALRLPLSPDHPLVPVIAAQTQLTVRAVKDEQQRRHTQRGPGVHTDGLA